MLTTTIFANTRCYVKITYKLHVNIKDVFVRLVCVHGGGGTAFKAWVEEWCKRGYAAISIAVEGQTDERLTPQPPTTKDCGLTDDDNNPHNKNPPYWVSHSHPGPRRPDVAYGDFDETLSNQWMFHCVADTILANTLMRSFASQVDPNRIGLTGISWGGVITSTVAGLDSRFSLVIPIYGCGDLGCANSYLGKGIQGHVEFYNKVWDACLYLPQATMPSLWISWPDDPHFPMINLKHSYEAMGSTRYAMVSLIPGLQHGHAVGWSRPESYTFAKYVWNRNSKRGWCHQISGDVVHHVGNTMAQVKFISALPFQRAELVSTNDDDNVQAGERTWQYSSCVLKSSATPSLWAAEAFLPQDTASWVINLYTGHDTTDGLVVTSTYQDLNLFAYAVMVDAMQVPEQPKAKGWFW